jgi:Trp operon repressor
MKKLTADEKKEIVESLIKKNATQRELANKYKVGKGTIQRIFKNKIMILNQRNEKVINKYKLKYHDVDVQHSNFF